jgi:hypothetical protein
MGFRTKTILFAVALATLFVSGASCSSGGGSHGGDGGAGDAGADGEAGTLAVQCKAKGDLPFAWAKRVASGLGAGTVSVASDGSMRMSGSFRTTNLPTVFAPGAPNETTLTSTLGTDDAWIAKIGVDGAVAWVKTAGGTGEDEAAGAAAFEDGTTRAVGNFVGTAVFAKGESNETQIVTTQQSAMFVARYETDGTLAWVKKADGSGTGHPFLTVAAPDGSLRVFGLLSGTVTFGPGEGGQTALTASPSTNDVFMASYATDGTLSWAKRLQSMPGFSVAMKADGGMILAAGASSTQTTLAIGEPNETKVPPTPSFFASYDKSGALLTIAATSGAPGADLALGADGSLTVTGTLFDQAGSAVTVTFGKNEPAETAFTGSGADYFIARYTPDFKLAWAKRGGDPVGKERGTKVGVASDGSLRMVGTYSPSSEPILGPGELGAVKLPASACNGSSCDIPFLANFAADGTVISGKRLSAQVPSVVKLFVLPDGTLRIAGGFVQSATFGEGEPGATTLTGGSLYTAAYAVCP